MKLHVRRSASKRAKMIGFRTRSKTHSGRNIIKRRIKKSGAYRVG